MIPSYTEETHSPTWGYQDLGLFVILGTLCLGVAQLLTLGIVHALHLDSRDRVLALMPSQILVYALLLGVLFAIIKLQYGRGFLRSLAWADFSMTASSVVVLGLMLAVFNALASWLLRTPQLETPLKHLLERRATAIEFGVLGTTLAPFCEELVFRGFIQPVVVQSFGPAIGILITSALFGALHLAQNGFAWQSGVIITLAGLAFGWMRQISGSTKASTLMHAAYNCTLFIAVFSPSGNLAK